MLVSLCSGWWDWGLADRKPGSGSQVVGERRGLH